jgi:hypothetical protein
VNAVSSPYDNWVALYQPGFTINLPAEDQDGDGLTNRQEFAFGLNPTSGSSVNPITTGVAPATGNFSYTRNANSGLTYKVWSSPDLATWTERTGAVQTPVGTPDSFGTQTVDVTNLGATPVGGKLFVRPTLNPAAGTHPSPGGGTLFLLLVNDRFPDRIFDCVLRDFLCATFTMPLDLAVLGLRKSTPA